MITHGAALLGPQGHDHPLGCRYLHLLGDAPQRDRGHHLGGRSSVWRSSRRGLACSSTSSSSDESFCTCLKHARNVMDLCSFMRRAELLAQQPVLSGAVVFGACVCGRVTTRLVQTCAVTLREHVGSSRRPWSGNKKISADGHVHTKQGHLWAKQPVRLAEGWRLTLPPHSSPQPPCFDGFESSSRRLAVQWLHNGADTCSPRPPVRICSLPPAPSARNLHPFHPRLYDF